MVAGAFVRGLSVAVVLSAAGWARAGGLELPDNGTVGFGRAGAFAARASDPTALMYNTAAIVGLPGVQVSLGSNFGFLAECFQRAGTYDGVLSGANIERGGTVFSNSAYDEGTTRYPAACRDPLMTATPNLAITWRILPTLAIGIGAYAPNSAGSTTTYPDRQTTSTGFLVPSPVRSMIFRKSLFLVHPTIAIAWEPIPGIRIGAAIQPSFASFRYGTMINTVANAAQSPDTDLLIELAASGWFLAGNFAMQVIPLPFLSFGGQVHLNQELNLTGTANAIANYYYSAPEPASCPDPSNGACRQSSFAVTRMFAPLPHTIRVGARFNLPRPGHAQQTDRNPREGRDAYDPMRDDVFDIEVNGFFENTRQMSDSFVETTGFINVGGTTLPSPRRLASNSDFHHVWGVRIGSDVNIVPGVVALRAGVSYENGAQSDRLSILHIASFDTYSVHGGASFRWRAWTLNVGYGHFFFADLDSSRGTRPVAGPMGAISQMNCAQGAGQGGCTVNRGVFSGNVNTLSASLNARF